MFKKKKMKKKKKKIPVIFLTVKMMKRYCKGFELGAVDYMTKPFIVKFY